MTLITYTPITDGAGADDQLFNARFQALHDVINGNLDSANLADNAITTSKITNDAVTTAKIPNLAVTSAKIEAQQDFIAPTLINAWVNYDTSHSLAGYMKDSLGFVHLRGLVKNGSAGNMFVLPVGYRNTKNQHFAAMAQGAFALIRIDINGTVQVSGHVGTAYVTVDGITFKADA